MTLTIQLPPDLEERLQDEAARRGQAPAEYARAAIEEKLAAPTPGAQNSIYAGLPRRDPQELSELARQQGAPAAVQFDDLMQAAFWPQDESADEFIRALRERRREGHEGPHG